MTSGHERNPRATEEVRSSHRHCSRSWPWPPAAAVGATTQRHPPEHSGGWRRRRRQEPRRRGPPRDPRRRRPGRHRHRADRAGAGDARPDPGLLHRLHRDHEPGHPGADAVRVQPGERRDGAGPGHGDRPRPSQRGQHRVDLHAEGRPQVRGRHRRQGRGRGVRHLPLVRDRGAARRPDVPAAVLPGRRHLQGPVQGQGPLQGRRGRRQRHHHQDVAAVPGDGLLRIVPRLHRHPGGEGHEGGVRQPPAGHRSLHVRGLQAGLVADAGQEPQLGPRHRPGPHPVGRQVGLQVR